MRSPAAEAARLSATYACPSVKTRPRSTSKRSIVSPCASGGGRVVPGRGRGLKARATRGSGAPHLRGVDGEAPREAERQLDARGADLRGTHLPARVLDRHALALPRGGGAGEPAELDHGQLLLVLLVRAGAAAGAPKAHDDADAAVDEAHRAGPRPERAVEVLEEEHRGAHLGDRGEIAVRRDGGGRDRARSRARFGGDRPP